MNTQSDEILNAIVTSRALYDRDRLNAHSNERELERIRQERCNSLIIR